MPQAGGKARFSFTMIELMIVLVIVAILTVSALFFYRPALLARAYEAEILNSMGTLRTLQVIHRAEHGYYASEINALAVSDADFRDMRYVTPGDFSIEDYNSGAGTYKLRWQGEKKGYYYQALTMDQSGKIERIEPEENSGG